MPSSYNQTNTIKDLNLHSKCSLLENYKEQITLILTNPDETNFVISINKSEIQNMFDNLSIPEFYEYNLIPLIRKVASCTELDAESALDIIYSRLDLID